jgi:hypothetical protein
MTLALIISRYNHPTEEGRRKHLREAVKLAQWATRHGYTPVGWHCDIDPDHPVADDDPEARRAALARSAERARWVAHCGGAAVVADWYPMTSGMEADAAAFRDYCGIRAMTRFIFVTAEQAGVEVTDEAP